jgi:pilus assembly protein CpaF
MSDLLSFGALSPAAAEVLFGAVKARINMLISGGTGSGKTTLLNILSEAIPSRERVVTIEDSA